MDIDLSALRRFRDDAASGSPTITLAVASMDTAVGFEEHRAWEKALFDADESVPAWPSMYGGRDCDLIEWLITTKRSTGCRACRSGQCQQRQPAGAHDFQPAPGTGLLPASDGGGERIWAQGWSDEAAPTSQASRPRRSSTVTTSSSTDRRPGVPMRLRRLDLLHRAHRARPSATRDSPISSCPPRHRGWNGGRRPP